MGLEGKPDIPVPKLTWNLHARGRFNRIRNLFRLYSHQMRNYSVARALRAEILHRCCWSSSVQRGADDCSGGFGGAKTRGHRVVCDDGSSDLTSQIAEKLGAEVVRHKRNLGYGAAIQSLFKRARELDADVLVTLDGDGQNNPSEIPSLVKPLVDDVADVVIGSRFVDEHSMPTMPAYRRVGIEFVSKLLGAASKHGVKDAQSGFRAYNRRSIETLSVLENGMGASVEILMNAIGQGLRIQEIPATCT